MNETVEVLEMKILLLLSKAKPPGTLIDIDLIAKENDLD
jgi:hypothetical protein